MDNFKVSVVVPIYNVASYLDRCMQSLLHQTMENIEIILVDDESPDNCPMMCDQYALMDSRVKVIHKKNEGLGFARNSGLDIATGEFVAFLDSDDFVDESMYEKLYATAVREKADAVFCGFNFYKEEVVDAAISEVHSMTVFEGQDIKNKVLLNMIACEPQSRKERSFFMSVWHSIYSLSLIKKYGLRFCSEREIISEDIVFQMDYLTKSKRVVYIPDCLYYYCFNQTSLSRVFRKDRNFKILQMYEALMRKAECMKWDVYEKQRIMRLFIGYSRSAMIDLCISELSYSEKMKILYENCSNSIWHEIFSQYPYKKLPKIYALFCFLIKKKNCFLICVLSYVKKYKCYSTHSIFGLYSL